MSQDQDKKIDIDALDKKIEKRFDSISDDIKEIRNIIIERLLEENKLLKAKVQSLEDRITMIEKDTHASNQYSRRNNVEICGIPDTVKVEELEDKVIKILHSIDVNITDNDR